jgi:hypothetical protein
MMRTLPYQCGAREGCTWVSRRVLQLLLEGIHPFLNSIKRSLSLS